MATSGSTSDLVELIHYRATRKLARDPFEYDLTTLIAILHEGKAAERAAQAEAFGEVSEEAQPHWSEIDETARVTGDALIDKWEREIAMGLEPDLDEQG